jgi:hypothetical protein
MMVEWSNMSNTEIRMKMQTMEMEYESIKNKINNLMDELEKLDVVYNKGKKELERRIKKC